jgi:S-adenosylmethionine decarboxylase
MLDQVNCKILSVVDSEHVDAYLLSESSMFVFPHKLILKTCGTTTLLFGLHRLLEIAAVDVGFPSHNSASAKTKAAATPYRVFYSRKNFLFPDKQHGPHRSWKEEVKYLDHMFTGGSAYMVGKMNGDHWYLYLTTPNTTLTPPRTPENQIAGTETKVLQVPFSSGLEAGEGALGTVDETLEVLMTDLNPENAKQFYLEHASAVAEEKYSKRAKEARREAVETLGNLNGDSMANSCMSLSGTTNGSTSGHDETFDVFSNTSSDHGAYTPDNDVDFPEDLNTEGHSLGTVVSEACGISEVYPTSRYPDARVDAYLFTPCGFSANGVIPAPDQAGTATHYFTVHVTPEPQCSYASFETNVPGGKCGRETVEVIEHVVNIFKPGRFSVTLFEAKADSAEKRDAVVDAKAAEMGRIRSAKMEKIRGYRRVERIVHDFDGYELVFRYYERNDWDGLAGPRLGEMDG